MNLDRSGIDGSLSCRLRLSQSVAIILRKEGCRGDPAGDFWMYENGYLLFQGLLSSNSVCWWNSGLNGAMKGLIYYGYVSPGALLVGAEPCALEVLRNAWSKRVLQPPPGYQISSLEEVEHCICRSVTQTQWTPLPEAVCSVVLRLSTQGRPAGIPTIREALEAAFPHVEPPSEETLYDILAQLTKERKLYNTTKGYYIVTPERRRSRSQTRSRKKDENEESITCRTMLMSTEEAMAIVHGDIATIRDGNVTHQCIQTNLADVICGGNTSDKILYPRTEGSSFPISRNQYRRGSLRFWCSNRRLRRSASTRTIAKHHTDTSSSTESPKSGNSTPTPKKKSLLSKLFRRSKPSQCQIEECVDRQFPPSEWFNSKAVHLQSVGTQTSPLDKELALHSSNDLEGTSAGFSRSVTLPRNFRRQLVNDTSTGSRESSPISRYQEKPLYRNKSLHRKNSRAGSGRPPPHGSTDSKTKQKKLPDRTTPTMLKQKLKSSPSPPVSEKTTSSTTESLSTKESPDLKSQKTLVNKNLADSQKINFTSIKNRCSTDIDPKRNQSQAKGAGTSLSHSNSFTLEVTTSQAGLNINKANATIINGSNKTNTKIFVQNSPVRSVFTFENGQTEANPNIVIINDTVEKSSTDTLNETDLKTSKNTNQCKESFKNLNNYNDPTAKCENMNNNRKLSLQKDGLNYNNLIKNIAPVSNNHFISNSNPDSLIPNTLEEFSKRPLEKYNKIDSSLEKLYLVDDDTNLPKKDMIGSEPNICLKDRSFARTFSVDNSLGDLNFNFKSLAAQKILKGMSVNSVDTS
ncbi:unnamed protein product [Acanthoscelides obtectus]|uniref:Winged helix Storkhead-box1 domain-containing protein n=1 Tax=Acanthoscelides obtectus TaxID=200917 RepID=A0A9P0JVA1_ACAOB|nr:unnamed protein product [Acanthoscelides obtectus]CAK1653025.1 Storkhead-box protein 1 [Acanthoscelides obtectus]